MSAYLDSGEFVERVIDEADEKPKNQFQRQPNSQEVKRIIESLCKKGKISLNELRSGSRRRCVVTVRQQIAIKLVREYGFTFAETARQLGASTSGISRSINKVKIL